MTARVLVALPVDGSFSYSVPEKLQDRVRPGLRVMVPFGRRTVTGFVTALEDGPDVHGITLKDIKRVVDKEEVFNDDLVRLSAFVSKMYLCSQGQALSAMVPSGRREVEVSIFGTESEFTPIAKLAPQQEAALKEILSGTGLYYLHGVTGSGKSEVYLRAAEKVISEGRQVIYLVPEITLTHQLQQDVMDRFPGRVAILHSALSPSQRLKEWRRIMHHEVDLVIGARSAVFAPCADLGLIIMDEEHEGSYKSGQTPRYHARQVAQERARMHGVSFIMGSATPSLEAWNMMEKGTVRRISMPLRVAGGSRPRIEVVSLLGVEGCISPRLEDEMRRTLLAGRSIMLFLNRRGYSYYYHCNSCGHVFECPHCSVAMTWHKKSGRLHCHYCGWSEEPSETCPVCGSTDIGVAGHGTEKVEEEVRRLFPSARTARLDTDVASDDRELASRIIDDFRSGRLDILLGTQMVAKGLNFPKLSLVGVINADSTLSVPDFRSQERTYSLLEQVAGRAGRYDGQGLVLIQTHRPDDASIVAVRDNRGAEFYKGEMEVRKLLGYPPFSRMVCLVLRGVDLERVCQGVEDLASVIRRVIDTSGLSSRVRILGVTACVIERRASSWRHQVLLSSDNILLLTALVRKALGLWKEPQGCHLEIDVDPLSLL